ncbi:alpha/beta hydrolase [Murimonas intestini]|uniref:Prolyl oligopeptidase family protein n=1 Tax=Murimonas intestini TaxID=1337051 RepID=A0AB73T9E2_9FIRM|nr:alpha/beta hydrolase [Murimonas intestini]MCR1864603.1 alpha/beta hydrolase [Murimonas intestini]MCR1882213.1 alpha/beta hydrolase [Murimonas intestini]
MVIETFRIWEKEEYSYEKSFGFIPKITGYFHEDNQERPCMIVVPGGGYRAVVPSEGELAALKFYESGYQAFVLTYTTDYFMESPLMKQPLFDISRAVRYIRLHSDRFHVLTGQIVVCGFSAGGHLCASLCVHHGDIEDLSGKYSGISNRPDAAVLCYPVISAGKYKDEESFTALLGKGASQEEYQYMSLEKHVNSDTPPCFIWTTAADDRVAPENSELYAEACRRNHIRCALHIFSGGKHGLSLADQVWAKGQCQPGYVLEQLENYYIQAVREGREVPQEVLNVLGKDGADICDERKVSKEAEIWPLAAASFLEQIFMGEDKE